MTQTMSQLVVDLSVATLTQEAHRNIARYLADRGHNEDPYAFELFRRAIVESDQDAWAALYGLYRALVRTWIANHLPTVHIDVCEALTNDAFVKFFRAVPAARFGQFPATPVLLAYLKTCARSVAADSLRSQRARQAEESMADFDHEIVLADPAEEVMMQMQAREIWEAIGAVVDEQEHLVLQVICVLGWPARTLPRLYPELFPTVQDVYRIKRNVLERLRRNRQLQAAYRTTCRDTAGRSKPTVLSPVSVNKGAMQ
jgi:DNA-directed RNA polymerase specialized sigma24 family protein